MEKNETRSLGEDRLNPLEKLSYSWRSADGSRTYFAAASGTISTIWLEWFPKSYWITSGNQNLRFNWLLGNTYERVKEKHCFARFECLFPRKALLSEKITWLKQSFTFDQYSCSLPVGLMVVMRWRIKNFGYLQILTYYSSIDLAWSHCEYIRFWSTRYTLRNRIKI